MQIRSYRPSDEAAVLALWSEVLPDSAPHNDPAMSLRMKLQVDRELLLVGLIDGAVAGTVMGGYDGHRGWVYSLAVAPDYRHRGLATALMHHLEQALTQRGCLKVNLQVRRPNAGVVAFYERLGYSVEDLLSLGRRLY